MAQNSTRVDVTVNIDNPVTATVRHLPGDIEKGDKGIWAVWLRVEGGTVVSLFFSTLEEVQGLADGLMAEARRAKAAEEARLES